MSNDKKNNLQTNLNVLDLQLWQEIYAIESEVVQRKRKTSSNKVLDGVYYPTLPTVAPVKAAQTNKKAPYSLIDNSLLDPNNRLAHSRTRKALGKALSPPRKPSVSVVPHVDKSGVKQGLICIHYKKKGLLRL